MGPLIILFGTRAVNSTLAEGSFQCPSCNGHAYRHRRARRFFTLYFIPLIPLDVLGEFVECTTCNGTYDVKILEFDPAAADAAYDAAFEEAVRRVMVLMLPTDTDASAEAIQAIQDLYAQFFERQVTEQQVVDEIAMARSDGRTIQDYVDPIGESLSPEGKEAVLQAAIFVAVTGGALSVSAQERLEQLGGALQMTPAHYNGVLDSVLNPATPEGAAHS